MVSRQANDQVDRSRGARHPVALSDVRRAAERLRGIVWRTQLLHCELLDERTGTHALIKPECLQRTGSFKLRGAYNKISSILPADRARGVVAFSSGNHAQAVALAARLLGARATILMPTDAPSNKVDGTRAHGAEILFYNREHDDREALAVSVASERGMTLIPPYDDPFVIAGQGTVGLELAEDAGTGGLDVLLVPVSGGGLIAGCAIAAKSLNPCLTVIGVEPENGDDTQRSLRQGHRSRISPPDTIADGLRAVQPGRLTFEIVQKMVDRVMLVSDEELLEAMIFCFEHLHVVAEPSGAAAVAALLTDRTHVRGKTVGVVISGGNIGREHYATLTSGKNAVQ